MFGYLKKIADVYMGSKLNKQEEPRPLLKSLDDNINMLKQSFSNSADLSIRQYEVDNTQTAVIAIEGMVNKEILADAVITPIRNGIYGNLDPKQRFDYIKDNLLSTSEQIEVETFEDVSKYIMSGFAVIAVDGYNHMLAIGIQGFSFRSISEPTSEVMQTGSKEGFVEALRINMTLVRRRIKNSKLKFETMSVGSLSKTDICLCYITDLVSEDILENIKSKINSIDLKTVLTSGYLMPYLEEKGDLSLFSSVGSSERPDTVCAKIAEGRVAVLIDGTPNALIVPYLFIEYFQTLDDYSERPYFATLTRWMKYIAFFISTLLPGLYVAIATFHPEFFSGELLNKIAKAVATTPFPLMLETLIIHFIYEIMREAGLRLPRPLGHAVSIVGALVIGETAVSSGLIGAPTLMVVALTAISSYVIPSIYEPTAVLRLAFIVLGGIMGIWGIMLLFSVVLINICSKNNYGIPFTAPISPFNIFSMRDVLIRAGWKALSKKENNIQNMPGVNSESEKR